MRDKGIDEKFIKGISDHLQPDTSALLLLVKEKDLNMVIKELEPFKGTVLNTDVNDQQEKKLRAALRE